MDWPQAGIKDCCMTFKVIGNFLTTSGYLFIYVLGILTNLNFSVLSILVFREFDGTCDVLCSENLNIVIWPQVGIYGRGMTSKDAA